METKNSVKEHFLTYKQNFETDKKQKDKKSFMLGSLKLILFALIIADIVLGIKNSFPILCTVSLTIFLVAFVGMWIYHEHVIKQINTLKNSIAVIEEHFSRFNDGWRKFKDIGQEFIDYNHPYTYDLDIFGENSLFQWVNVTKTQRGREKLFEDIANPQYSAKEIEERQKAIKELAEKKLFSVGYQGQGRKITKPKEINLLLVKLHQLRPLFRQKWQQRFFQILPAFTIVFTLAVSIFQMKALYIFAAAAVGIQFLMWLVFSLRVNENLHGTVGIKHQLEAYAGLFEQLSKEKFIVPLLLEIQKNTVKAENSAAKAIKKLDGVVQKIAIRNNFLMYVFLNIFFLWDINCAVSLGNWVSDYQEAVDGWFENLGELESLMSFAVIEQVLEDSAVYPEISDSETQEISAKSLGHPLISSSKRICNDFSMGREIIMISGSNMSGKTTFLRTIGINVILAKCGAPVCASSMGLSDITLISSMRISDDLSEGLSTFYTELKKIKNIVSSTEKRKNILFLIDEIFRGTNSKDRTEGAKAVIRRLSANGAAGLLTTHDLSLCTEEPTVSNNYHFSEQLQGEQLLFDYKIHKGIAKATNGKYLMKLLGLFQEE